MNRSLLLVVCDFLLLSILALARFDVPKDAVIAQDDQKVVSKEVVERISDGENYDDVVAELEATNETLLENLSSDKDDLVEQKLKLEAEIAQRQKELEQKEQEIASKDAVIEGNKEALDLAKKEAQKLESQRKEIERKREELLQSNAASKKELELLAKNLEQAKKQSEELAELKSKKEKEAEAARLELAASVERAKAQELAAAEAKALLIEEKKRSDELIASTAKIDQKIDSLNKGLDGVGKDLKSVGEGLVGVGEKISTVSDDVSSVKEGVSKVEKDVQESVEVQKENFRKLNERQTRSVNEIFTRYEQNKVSLDLIYTHKSGIFQTNRDDKFSVDTILMVDGNFVYALVHAKDSPFRVEFNPRKLVSVTGQITGPKFKEPLQVKEIAFMDDPRIIIVPLYANPQELAKTGIELFNAPENPFLFDDAVVVDVKDGRFGQTKCLRDEKDGRYIEVDEKHFAFLTGAFNPGKGDLVFSQKAELLGIMVNGDYAFHVKNLGSRIHGGSRTLLGSSFQADKTNALLHDLSRNLSGLNKKFKY
ncbi:MAG: hypothetical protein CMI20_07400 [Opitutae bacterium]|nr:hypothetical protein [Opitutae bacterium]|tara:strand:- start:841 stop:2457 length:1617 start_codon:yes stop_codon:yes gene_type:complete